MNQSRHDTERQIRVFVSSTFRDMMGERDLLVKEVFPALRRKCAARFVTFTEVDLRWGITEEQASEGQVLPLCLAEIERSRPYFLGLLGERYGWIPESIAEQVIEREPWLQEHIRGRTSVTELEILHGVLNNPVMQHHAFFYFRDPAYAYDASLSDEERRDLIERDIQADVDAFGDVEARRRTQARKDKLAALKQRIRDSGLPLVEPYANPKALAQIVHQQLDALIDHIYPEDQTPDPMVQERRLHEAHAQAKLYACIDRPTHLAALDAFSAPAEHDGTGLVITGDSGGGKTALLAAWVSAWTDRHAQDATSFLFQHYFGATPDSTSPEGFLRRLMGELKSRFDIADDIPSDPEELRDTLPVWLAQTLGRGRVVLVLDGLNQVQGEDADRHLRFLPRHFPPNVAVLASALEGPALEALRERGWAEHHLPLATPAEVEAMVSAYLHEIRKTLEPALLRQLLSAPGVKNPLFLRTVLEELRQLGSFEALPERVVHYLEADTPKDLFHRVIARWQADFDGRDPQGDKPTLGLVRRALTHLWAARQGLSEPEWLDLLGDGTQPLPRALWTPLFLALETHLVQRAGLYNFGHDFLRQAVAAMFVSSTDEMKAAHLSIADYFELHPGQREMSARKAEEWPHQLRAGEAWERLEACLTDFPLFLALCNDKTKWELTGYWHPLRKRGSDMGASYTAAYARRARGIRAAYAHWTAVPARAADHFVLNELGTFLVDNGLYPSAAPLLERALEARERVLGPEQPRTLTSVNNLAALLDSQGDYAGAKPLYERALEARDRVLGPEHPHTLASVNNLASVLKSQGDYAGAKPLYERALEACERVLGPEHPHTLTSVNNLASVLQSQGDYAGAKPLYERALEACERVLGPEHPHTLTSVNNLASVLQSQGDYAAARSLLESAIEAQEQVLGPEHPDTLLFVNNLAAVLESRGDYAAARSLLERALEACERLLGTEHPQTLGIVSNLAAVLKSQGDDAGAQPLYQLALEGRERVLGPEHPKTLGSVENLAAVLESQGNDAGARPLYERVLEARERARAPDYPDILESVLNLALSLETQGDYAGAQPLYERALEICERVLGPEHPDTLTSVNILAELLYRRNDYARAQPLYERALEGRERVLGPEHLDTLTSLNSLADLLKSKGKYDDALPLFERALKARERVLGPEHLDTLTSVNALADLLNSKSKYDDAQPLYQRALEARERVLGPEHRDTLASMNNLGVLRENKGDCAGARSLFQRALEASERVLGPEHPDTLQTLMNLAALLDREADYVGAEPLFERAIAAKRASGQTDDPQFAVDLNNYALLLRKLGRFAEGANQLREAIDIEDRFLPPAHPKRAHRRNNLALVLTLAGEWVAAATANAQAWQLKQTAEGGHDVTSARILFVRLELQWLQGKDAAPVLGQLRTLLARGDLPCHGNVARLWDVEDILAYLQPRLSAERHEFLTRLVGALNDREGLPALDTFLPWREAVPQPLD